MRIVRRARDRGHAGHGWLDSNRGFSFDEYHDSAYGCPRVINE